MTSFRKAGALALALLSGVAFADVRPASAASLLDILFPKRQRSQEIIDQSTMPGVTKVAIGKQRNGTIPAGPGAFDGDPEAALPRVKMPSYYTYRAEPMRPISLPRMADPVVTSAVSNATTVQPAPLDADAGERRVLAEAKVRATDSVAKALEAWYGEGKPLLWVAGRQMNDRARSVLKALASADAYGLDPADYQVSFVPPMDYNTADEAGRDRVLMQFELELSAKALTYAQDAIRGRIDPNKISGYHDFKRKDVDLGSILKLMSMSPDAGAYLASRNPTNPQFEALKSELARLKAEESDEGSVVHVNLTGLLRPGQSNPELANIVAGIRKRGSQALLAAHDTALATYQGSPDYTPEIVALVEGFQKEVGLKPDGVIGQATVSRIVGVSGASKIDKLVVAMEELRWLPADLGQRFVFVNQPAFMAYYTDGGKEKVSMRVVVGGRNTQTYFFQDQIETVELHPYWGVPGSIIVNEMLPKLRQDPSYLDRLGYEVTYNGQRVSSSEISWSDTSKIGVRQLPGSDNALGELKILFPNSHAIYMHDTPQKSFFKKDMRALSHGCIRMAEPRVMAAAVLGTTVDDIAKQLAHNGNKAVPVPNKVPIYVSYFTAWPDKDGVVQYYDDVYGRDDYTKKALDVTTKARVS